MGCRSDHMEPSGLEKALSQVLCFKAEISGLAYDKRWLTGTHPLAYNQRDNVQRIHEETAELCAILKTKTPSEIQACSLELQIWWRDHQAFDAKRLAEKEEAARKEAIAKAALRKLNSEETEILRDFFKKS